MAAFMVAGLMILLSQPLAAKGRKRQDRAAIVAFLVFVGTLASAVGYDAYSKGNDRG